jgi:hypothetical protein
MDRVKLPVFAVIVVSSAVSGLAQPAANVVEGRYVIGLDNIKRNRTGKITNVDGALQFQTGTTNAKIPVASIDDIYVGRETTQAGGKAGTAAKTAAMAVPYDGGAPLKILLRTNVDILTLSNRDSNGGLHFAILALPKGQGEQQRTQLVAAGARVSQPVNQEFKERSPAAPAVQQKTKRQKFSASAIQIEPVDAGDVRIPPEFRAAVYEFLIIRVRDSGVFHKVFRSGDREAAAVPDLVTLHTTVENFKEGSQMKRELTTVLGATKLDVAASVTGRDGHVVLDGTVHGKVRFFGENLGVTNDLAKHIAKLLKQE